MDWNMVAALGQVSSSIIALIGLGFIGWQIREARKTADFQSLQIFLQSASEHEARLLNAGTADGKEQAFFEYLNFLETYASAANNSLFPKVTDKIVREKLRESVAMIEAFPEWLIKFQQAIITPNTFEQLRIFIKREIKEISMLRALQLNTSNS